MKEPGVLQWSELTWVGKLCVTPLLLVGVVFMVLAAAAIVCVAPLLVLLLWLQASRPAHFNVREVGPQQP